MTPTRPEHRLDIAVRDKQGALLPGAEIEFRVGGVEVGRVTSTDGRADITRPANDLRPMDVNVIYDGENQSAKVPAGEKLYTFRFKKGASVSGQEHNDTPPWRSILVVIVLICAAGAAVWLVIRSTPIQNGPVDPVQQEADLIAKICAGGRVIANESSIKSGLTEKLTSLTAGSKVTSADVGTITSIVKPDDVGLKFYESYIACLQQQTNSYLQLKGIQVQAGPSPDGVIGGSTTQSTSGPNSGSAPDGAKRWSYYEELNGGPTKDGVLMPPGSDKTAPYTMVKVGQLLKARRGFKIRDAPKGDAEVVDEPLAGTCVKVLSPPSNPVIAKAASSGGWLQISPVACP